MKELREKARAFARRFVGKTFKNRETGYEIMVSMSGVKHTIAHGNDGLVKTIPIIPDMLQAAHFLHAEKPKIADSNVLEVEKYSVDVAIEGEVKRMLITVKHQTDGRRYYDHGFWADK